MTTGEVVNDRHVIEGVKPDPSVNQPLIDGDSLQQLITRHQKHELSLKNNKHFYISITLFCILMALPDAITYHAYSAPNGQNISSFVHYFPINAILRYWCEYGAPLGVYFFALNNMLRWCDMINESTTLYKYYNKKRQRWVIFLSTTLLGALSVIPFYGMAKNANILFAFVIGNSIARFCMDHYSWQKIIASLFDRQVKLTRLDIIGSMTFVMGIITATYLYPFAKDASNLVFAIFGVVPTCLLWGLDAKVSWDMITKKILRACGFIKRENESKDFYDPGLKLMKNIVLGILFIIVLAGAFSETIMAAQNAGQLFYPANFLAVCAAIAFAGIYLTGPIQITERFFNFLQMRRQSNNSVNLQKQATQQLENYLQSKLVKSHESSVEASVVDDTAKRAPISEIIEENPHLFHLIYLWK